MTVSATDTGTGLNPGVAGLAPVAIPAGMLEQPAKGGPASAIRHDAAVPFQQGATRGEDLAESGVAAGIGNVVVVVHRVLVAIVNP